MSTLCWHDSVSERCSNLSADRATKIRLDPRLAKFRQKASPIPDEAPVTKTVRPLNDFTIVLIRF